MEKIYKHRNFRWLCLLFFLISFSCQPAFAAERYLVPVGQTIGITLNIKGVAIVDTSDVKSYDGKNYTPAKDAGFRSGDIIKKINGISVNSVDELENIVNEQGESELEVTFSRQGKEQTQKVNAVLSDADGFYRLGIWIKDAASGIGTITYYDPETNEFGALGHGISETSDSNVMAIQDGEILKANIVSIQKGSKGQPGELIGVFAEGKEKLGSVSANTVVGLKGTLDAAEKTEAIMDAIPVAGRDEAEEGEAEIIANIEGDNKEKYSVEIQKINKDKNDAKGMVIKVTDERLLDKTGGIVQGMSGCPIIQNGKLIGAVTHVLVNDPARGYGIFIENMLSEAF